MPPPQRCLPAASVTTKESAVSRRATGFAPYSIRVVSQEDRHSGDAPLRVPHTARSFCLTTPLRAQIVSQRYAEIITGTQDEGAGL